MVEFALIAPVFMALLFGAFDFSLWMYSIGSARFAAADAARVEAQVADNPGRNACGTVCSRLGIGQGTNSTDCDADCQALVEVAQSTLVTSSFARILEIDVVRQSVASNGACLTP